MTVSPAISTPVFYAAATAHYSSPRRRDSVKRLYEEPVTASAAVAALHRIRTDGPISVVDLGCGTGDGLSILTGNQATPPFTYHGIDADPDMIAAARHQHGATATFSVGDLRDAPGQLPDVYLSFGVPFSHLTAPELRDFLSCLGEQVRAQHKPVVVVIDVLGQYSVEWYDHWSDERWLYPMSFFEDATEHPTCDMTFHSPASIRSLADQAAQISEASFTDWTFTDRSPLVGRHTTASLICPDTPTYRKHLNDLIDGRPVDRHRLRFPATIPPGTAGLAYRSLAAEWNRVRHDHDYSAPPGTAWTTLGLRLLASLTTPDSAGIGHTLIATTTITP